MVRALASVAPNWTGRLNVETAKLGGAEGLRVETFEGTSCMLYVVLIFLLLALQRQMLSIQSGASAAVAATIATIV